MKAKIISLVLCGAFILVACMPAATSVPTKIAFPSQTPTPTPPTFTPTPTIWWNNTLTPLNLPTGNNDEIVSAIDQIVPNLCVRNLHTNYAILTPPPIGYDVLYPELQFIEVLTVPTPKPPAGIHDFVDNYHLDNIDKSFTAIKIFIPYTDENHAFGDSLYIVDNTTGKMFQVLAVGTGNILYLTGLRWLNKDTFFFIETGHAINIIIAINVKKQRYEYYSYFYESPC